MALEGKTIRPKRHLLGNNGLVEFEKTNKGYTVNNTLSNNFDLVELFNELVQQGFPHHVCVVEGKHAKRLTSFAKQTAMEMNKTRMLKMKVALLVTDSNTKLFSG